MIPMNPLRPDEPLWLTVASRELGQREVIGRGDNPRILEYLKNTGLNRSQLADETSWCAAFVGWCLEQAGIRSTRRANARSYLDWGKALPEPTPGCVVVFSRGNNPAQGHVAFWLGRVGAFAIVLGGNQGNAVSVAPYDVARVVGYRWPLVS